MWSPRAPLERGALFFSSCPPESRPPRALSTAVLVREADPPVPVCPTQLGRSTGRGSVAPGQIRLTGGRRCRIDGADRHVIDDASALSWYLFVGSSMRQKPSSADATPGTDLSRT